MLERDKRTRRVSVHDHGATGQLIRQSACLTTGNREVGRATGVLDDRSVGRHRGDDVPATGGRGGELDAEERKHDECGHDGLRSAARAGGGSG